jgi:hypothetical protein
MKLREQLQTLEGRQAHVGAVAASELESALASVRQQVLVIHNCLVLIVPACR